MNRMGIPQPDCTPDGVLAEIARVVPFFKGAKPESRRCAGKQRFGIAGIAAITVELYPSRP